MNENNMTAARFTENVKRIRGEIRKVFIGQDEVLDQILICLLSSGHALVEGLPGLGKTLLVRALAKTFVGSSARIQFTPDLMPSDITGHVFYDVKEGVFVRRKGPVFVNLLIADEINRSPAKTQAALLEVMQEHQVSLDGETMSLELPFMTMATMNPFEHEGTYPLPDAQMDRFLLKILIRYPGEKEEADMAELVCSGRIADTLDLRAVNKVLDTAEITAMQTCAAGARVDRSVTEYAVKIVRATRSRTGIACGAGPRGTLALIRAGRVKAFMEGRDYVLPDDIKEISLPALRHRITLTPELEIEGRKTDDILVSLLAEVPAPRS